MVIDLHSHYFPLAAVWNGTNPAVNVSEGTDGGYVVEVGGHRLDISHDLFDLDTQREALQRQGLDRRTLMPPPYTILYELDAEAGLDWSRMLNDAISKAALDDPDEFIGFATVPLQDPEMAVQEVRRAIQQLGMGGVEILTNVNGGGLDDPALEPFWEEVERLRVPMLIHPNNVAGGERMGAFYLRNLIGNPTETAQAGARILFAGVLERYPDLKIILSHGGGALPNLIGRLRHGFEVRPECRERAEHPIESLRRFYYDTVVFEPVILRHLVEIVGIDQIVLGTDFPFDMGETDPVGFVRDSGLSQSDVHAILRSGEQFFS
jgi:aminocarboxymuconate-semialdehyde decarboxylase